MKTLFITVLVTATLILGCNHAARRVDVFDVSAKGKAEIYRFVQTYLEGANQSDVSVLASMVLNSPQVTSVANGKMIQGWDAICHQSVDINNTGLDLRVSLRGAPRQYQLARDALLVVAPYTLTVANSERSVDLEAITTLVLVKQEESWKVLHEHNSAIPPEPEQEKNEDDN